jgi:hypothetical protein
MRSSEILNSDFIKKSPCLIALGFLLGAIGYFASTGKKAEMFGIRKRPK